MANIDFDAMEEYCIIGLSGGEVPPVVLSEKRKQTERLNIVEKEIQTEQCKLANVATPKILSKTLL